MLENKNEKCYIGLKCKHCDPDICKYYKHSYSRVDDQDEKEKENERIPKDHEAGK